MSLSNTYIVIALRNAATFKQTHCRLFWIGITLAAVAVTVYQTVTIIQNYLDVSGDLKLNLNLFLQYVKDTNVQFHDTIGSTFPAVTICNLNPVRLNALDSVAELQKLVSVFILKIYFTGSGV